MFLSRSTATRALVACLAGAACAAGLVGAAAASGKATASTSKLVLNVGYIGTLAPADASSIGAYQILNATCANLVNWKDEAGSKTLFPDAASAMPTLSNGGRTYTFTIRPHLGFSTSGAVTAGSFIRAFEGVAKSPSSLAFQYASIVAGFTPYANGTAGKISGLTISGGKLVVTLKQPDGAFLPLLAGPWFCPYPANQPLTQPSPPSSGPYYVSQFASDQSSATLLRNPHYGGTRPAAEPELDFVSGPNPSADATFGLYGSQWAGDYGNYGPGHSPQQAFEWPGGEVDGLAFDVKRPKLTVTVRRAIATGIDRTALAHIDFNGVETYEAASPSSNFLAPVQPGYTGPSVYSLAGNLSAARRLMAGIGYSAGHQLTLIYLTRSTNDPFYPVLKAQLAKFYISVTLDTVSSTSYPQVLKGTTWDLARQGWYEDFNDGWDNLEPMFGSNGTANDSHYASKTFDSQLQAANAEQNPAARASALGKLADSLATGDVPGAMYENNWDTAFVSSRTRCVVHSPTTIVDVVLLQDKALGACKTDAREAAAPRP